MSRLPTFGQGITPPTDDASLQRSLRQLEERVTEQFRQLGLIEILEGQIIKDVVFTGAEGITVDHKLGRVPQGYLVIKRNANNHITQITPDPTVSQITLRSQGTITVSLWIF